jgi:hypothetical protein
MTDIPLAECVTRLEPPSTAAGGTFGLWSGVSHSAEWAACLPAFAVSTLPFVVGESHLSTSQAGYCTPLRNGVHVAVGIDGAQPSRSPLRPEVLIQHLFNRPRAGLREGGQGAEEGDPFQGAGPGHAGASPVRAFRGRPLGRGGVVRGRLMAGTGSTRMSSSRGIPSRSCNRSAVALPTPS